MDIDQYLNDLDIKPKLKTMLNEDYIKNFFKDKINLSIDLANNLFFRNEEVIKPYNPEFRYDYTLQDGNYKELIMNYKFLDFDYVLQKLNIKFSLCEIDKTIEVHYDCVLYYENYEKDYARISLIDPIPVSKLENILYDIVNEIQNNTIPIIKEAYKG